MFIDIANLLIFLKIISIITAIVIKVEDSMKKTILCIILILVSIFSFTLAACSPNKPDEGPVANAELDEYNQIVSQMKVVFAQSPSQASAMSTMANNEAQLFASTEETAIESMFAMMEGDSTKKESADADYYAYGIDFSTMTARIAGYAANNFFQVSSFYGLNILMDYGGSNLINASVEKVGNTIKTYLFTTFEDVQNNTFKEYNYAEINFTSQTDFNIIVIDYVYDEQNVNTGRTMIYASSKKDFFLMSGELDDLSTSIVFFNKGGDSPAYIIDGKKSSAMNSGNNRLARMMDDKLEYLQVRYDKVASRYPQLKDAFYQDMVDSFARFWVKCKYYEKAKSALKAWKKKNFFKILKAKMPLKQKLGYLYTLYIKMPKADVFFVIFL